MSLFENTKVAFAAKDDKALKKAQRLFQLIGYPWLIKIGPFFLNIALWLHLPIKGLIKRTIFQQFCGGESIDDSLKTIADLGKYNVGAILDYSVEGKNNEADFERGVRETLRNIKTASSRRDIPFAVFKPTGIASYKLLEKASKGRRTLTSEEEAALKRIEERIDKICALAHRLNVPILIDAEETWFQDIIDEIALEMMRKYNKEKAIVYNTPQMYRKHKLAYIKNLHSIAKEEGFFAAVKIVRGAYMEKERERAKKLGYDSPIEKNKAATDRDFNAAIEFCLNHIEDIAICCGSHNEKSASLMIQLINEKGLNKNDSRIYFAQLYGMSDHVSFNLAKEGYNVAKYLPYGPVADVVPYLIRRAQENTSVSGQQSRELGFINDEIQRRKKA